MKIGETKYQSPSGVLPANTLSPSSSFSAPVDNAHAVNAIEALVGRWYSFTSVAVAAPSESNKYATVYAADAAWSVFISARRSPLPSTLLGG